MAGSTRSMVSNDTYFIKPGYTVRNKPVYFEDNLVDSSNIVHQPDVYQFTAYLARRFGSKRIIDIGCGRAHKFVPLHPEFQLVGVDYGSNLDYCRHHYDFGQWVEHDLEQPSPFRLKPRLVRDAVIVCEDVIEHLVRPDGLIDSLKVLMNEAAVCILTTPDRNRIRGPDDMGPPGNHHHVREWNLEELRMLLRSRDFTIEFSGRTLNNDQDRLKTTSIVVLGRNRLRQIGPAPSDYRIVAFMNAYNEVDIIRPSVEHLNRQGVDVYLIDNWSTDGTYELACSMVGKGIIQIDRFPPDGPSQHFTWKLALANLERLSQTVQADWFIHHDVDELRESPWRGVSIRDALYHVDQRGFNCIDHMVLTFPPTDNDFRSGSDFAQHLKYYEPSDKPGHFRQMKAWKNIGQSVSLADSGGHEVQFEGRRVYPYKFLLKHYPIRSQIHGEKKIFQDRKQRWDPVERARGWHVQYDHIDIGHSFLRGTSELKLFNPATFYEDYLVERLSSVGVPCRTWAEIAALAQGTHAAPSGVD